MSIRIGGEHKMNRKFQSVFSATACSLVAVVLMFQAHSTSEDVFCEGQENAVVNTALPLSHPDNLCATRNISDVSWGAWLAGRSKGYQFHYLDLLELLSRISDDSSQKPTGN